MDTRLLRARARENISSHWGLAIGAAVMAWLLAGMGSSIIPNIELTQEVRQIMNYDMPSGTHVSVRMGLPEVLALAHFIIGGVIQLGYAKFLLKEHDHADPEFNDLFSEFDRFGDGFAQNALRGIYIILWSLLLIIPGIVASYSYAMTPYIMAENPGMKANEAIARSKEMMDGHKGELFWLELTFIGWDLLAGLTLNIGYLWLNPYRNAAQAAFYRQLQAQQQ